MSAHDLASNPDSQAESLEDAETFVINDTGSREQTPGTKEQPPEDEEQQHSEEKESGSKSTDNDDDEPEETLSERLWGLTEMFPEPVIKTASTAVLATKLGLCRAVSACRTATWIIFSSSIVLFAPLLLEVERANMQEMQKNQQKELLLGPTGVISGGVPPMLIPSTS